MTIRQALTYARARLQEAGYSPQLAEAEARQLLGWLVGEGVVLWKHINNNLTKTQLSELNDALKRRSSGEPLQLIIGTVEFFGLTLAVRPGVLIPRPETEFLVELALKQIESVAAPRVLDIGVGNGAIALVIKYLRPDAEVFASDISPAALELARSNASALGLEINFRNASLAANLNSLDLIVSNPPYLPLVDKSTAPPELEWEADSALYAGADGLAVTRPLISEAKSSLKNNGWLVLELDPRNVKTAANFAVEQGFISPTIHTDASGVPRFLCARRG